MSDKKKTIKRNIASVKEKIFQAEERAGREKGSVTLIVVTKTYPYEHIQGVLDCGSYNIGENRVQEIDEKIPKLSGTKIVHLIGHLQKNKVNKAVPLVDWIHSADSEKIIEKINSKSKELGKRMNLLVQVNTSREESKSGCEPKEAVKLAEFAEEMSNIDFKGFMTIGPLHGTKNDVRESFRLLRKIRDSINLGRELELSMGMSGDFEMAIEEGATMVRVGSLIMGERNYA